MNEEREPKGQDDFFLWRLIDVIIRWRRLLIFNTVLAVILTFAILKLFFPNWYSATASIMPPEKEVGSLGLGAAMLPSGLSSLLSGSGLALPGLATPSDLYAAILRSNAVSRAVIAKNNLKEVFDARLESDALKELADRTSILVLPEGIITVSYEDRDPLRAANVANSLVEELNRVNQENLVSKAKAMREFIDGRLTESVRDLTTAEDSLKAFQTKHNAVALDEQIKASIDAIADLHGQLVLAEIELGVMEKSLSRDNARYKNQVFKIQQIKMQLEKLEEGSETRQDSFILNVPIKEAPELGMQYARLVREVKIQETIFQLLKQQYEQARIEEMRNTPTVQVLDAARPPEKKSRPHRASTALMGGILSFGLTFFFVVVVEFVDREKSRNSVVYQRVKSVTRVLNEDLFFLRSAFRKKRKENAD